jgi:hypothetical protein
MNDPQVVKFCNEAVRPTADKLVAALYAAQALVDSYDATGVAAKLGTDETFTNWIDDGSASDGRPTISAGGVALTVESIRGLLAQLNSTQTPSGLSLAQGVISISPRYAG